MELVKASMATVLQMNTKLALVGIFDQIMGEDETIREKGLKYVTGPLIDMRQKLFDNLDKEKFLLNLIKKVCFYVCVHLFCLIFYSVCGE